MARFKSMRALFSKPERWTRGQLARDKDGYGVDGVRSRNAVSFCLLGAIENVYGTGRKAIKVDELVRKYLRTHSTKFTSTVNYNDKKGTSFGKIQKLVKALKI